MKYRVIIRVTRDNFNVKYAAEAACNGIVTDKLVAPGFSGKFLNIKMRRQENRSTPEKSQGEEEVEGKTNNKLKPLMRQSSGYESGQLVGVRDIQCQSV